MSRDRIRAVLRGEDVRSILSVFDWGSTPQGARYWDDLYLGRSQLSQDDRDFLLAALIAGPR